MQTISGTFVRGKLHTGSRTFHKDGEEYVGTYDEDCDLISGKKIYSDGTVETVSAVVAKPSPLKLHFLNLSKQERILVQSKLATLNLYLSTIDGLYGKGTAAALKAYNKEYLANADLSKKTNVNALMRDILTPLVIEDEEASADKCDLASISSCLDIAICDAATKRNAVSVMKWVYEDYGAWVNEAITRGLNCNVQDIPQKLCTSTHLSFCMDNVLCAKSLWKGEWRTPLGRAKPFVNEARRRGLSCGVGNDIPKQSAAVEQPEPEPTPKLDIAQVKASYDAKDYTKAFEDAQVLAVQGDPEAQLLLGKMFADGRGTLQVSTVAHMWFNIASMGGIDEAYEERKTITAQMTPSAVEEAQKMAMSCIQSNYADCGLTVKPVAVKQPKPVDKTYITSGSQVEAWFKDETRLKRKQLHYALKKLGVYNSSVDGLWGPNTSRAFTRYINKYKRDAENVDEVFSSVLSKVKVPSSFSTSKNTNSSNSPSNKSSKSGLTAIISNPSVAANQAMAICQPKAEIQAQNEYERRKTRGSGKITCKTKNDIMGWGSDTECKQSSGGGFPGLIPLLLEIDPASVAERAAKDRYNNTLNSCLAQYGWKK